MALIELVDEGRATVVTEDETEAGKKRRLRAPRRRPRAENMPQDKPIRSQAAQAAAAGTPGAGDVSPHPDVVGDETAAQAGADESAAAAATQQAGEADDDVLPHDASAGGVPEGGKSD